MSTLIKMEGLSKKYGSKQALEDVSFTVERGSIVAVLGHNGAGKTTLINSIMDIVDYEGRIEYGFDRKELYRKVGYQMQSSSYEKEAKVYEVCKLYRKILKSDVDLDSLLEEFDFASCRNMYVKNLSGGQRQKLSILLTLIGEPELIIFDELSTGLDSMTRRQIWDYIKRLNEEKGVTIILTSHFLDEVEYLADRVVILDKGRISRIGDVSTLIREEFEAAKKIEFRTDDREAFGQCFGSELSNNGGLLCIRYKEDAEEEIYRQVKRLGGYDIAIKNYTFEDAFLKMLGYKLVKNGEISHG
ncbi:ABC transporter ATP-binding protein [Saccharibacillus alkalitolerans]|uniref:ABC transporter ATP-binding protein n=1 Tax=Saccharibacillus alkalitolerans TaxID=2705290 RepID=A0ABX0F6Y9_9BACL|nr:ABC transporter ATP-binding protein [Saccharibacillus alkalitolerans]NGZ75299.1 ABC transporter ATP-binding protein [Saccharibacillus alkalitolerans]